MVPLNVTEIFKKKKVIICNAAGEEFLDLPLTVREKFRTVFTLLEKEGQLRVPAGKKLSNTGLFEIRVRIHGQWRSIYAYYKKDQILILRFFQKKTQKTPEREIKIALLRLINF
jgi:phage-related protein